jgi:hypothetical protein
VPPVGNRWDRFQALASREDRRVGWSALWIAVLVVLAGASSGLLTPAVDGKRLDVALLAPGILAACGVAFAFYLAAAPLLHLWPHRAPSNGRRNVLALLLYFGDRDLKELERCVRHIAFLHSHPEVSSDQESERAYADLDRARERVRDGMVEAENKVRSEFDSATSILFKNHAHIAVNRSRPEGMEQSTSDVWDDAAARLQWLAQKAEQV